jgi:L-lactate dehydrogenase complex protein LldG
VERQRFLDNIAWRLGRPRVASAPSRSVFGPPPSYVEKPLGTGVSEPVERFKTELELVGGKVAIAASLVEVQALLRAELDFWKARQIVSWAAAEFDGWGLDRIFAEKECLCYRPSADPEAQAAFRKAALEADVGITAVDFAIANTGTLAIAARAGRPRSVSLLPTVHFALVKESQLVDRLGHAFTGYRNAGSLVASNVHFITGPSRTSDIENDLSIGVHGPAAVSVILWRNAS